MPNKYFNPYPVNPSYEQNTIDDIIQEAIAAYGASIFYLPRNSQDVPDYIYGEDPVSLFNKAYTMDVYVQNVNAFDGQSEFFSKFGLEIRDSVRVLLARRTFQKYIPTLPRPREGDLVYMPQFSNMFEIKFVEEDYSFHLLGRRPPYFYFFELHMEMYKFSNEKFRTGVQEIDQLGMDYSYTISMTMNPTGAGVYQKGEVVYQGASNNRTATAYVKSWDRNNHILEIVNIKGIFNKTGIVTGNTSGATFAVSNYDRRDFEAGVVEEFVDNKRIETEANTVIVIDPDNLNPFGEPQTE